MAAAIETSAAMGGLIVNPPDDGGSRLA